MAGQSHMGYLSSFLAVRGSTQIDGTDINKFFNSVLGVHNNISATAGGGIARAAQLGLGFNEVDTVASAGDSVVLPQAIINSWCWVYNGGASSLAIYNSQSNYNNGGVTDVIVPPGSNVANAGNVSVGLGSGHATLFVCMVLGVWKQISDFAGTVTGGGGIAEAPTDGTTYGRNSASWVHLTHNDVTDWAATLAPYALTASVPVGSNVTPSMDGTAAIGTGTTWARADHVHPTDTSRYAANNPAGFQTAANVTASLAGYLPLTGGTVSGGTAFTAGIILTGPPNLNIGGGTAGQPLSSAGGNMLQWGAVPLPLAGGTMTGPITLAGDPTANLQPATMQYVDGVRYGDNRVINGDMRIDQRNNGASGTAGGYTVDRWQLGGGLTGKGTWGRNLASATSAAGFPYYLGWGSSGSYTPVAADALVFQQAIEADMISDFAWGTANAQPVTLSFWINISVAGTFSGSLRNYASTRSYPFTFTVTAGVWTKVAIAIPGDTSGTWVMSGNAGALMLGFDLGSGSTYRALAGAWVTGNFLGATGAASVLTAGSSLFVTGVKLEIGSVATPFNRQSLAKSLVDCQRYYSAASGNATWWNGNTTTGVNYYARGDLPVQMRATPTITLTNANANMFPTTVGSVSSVTPINFMENRLSNATGNSGYFSSTWTASAEL